MQVHLTSATEEETTGGFELYRFEVSSHILPALAEKIARIGRDSELIMRETFLSFYLHPERPRPSEVAQVKVEPSEREDLISVTLTLRRGHLEIAKFLRHSPAPMVFAKGAELVFVSEGQEVRRLPISSIPLE